MSRVRLGLRGMLGALAILAPASCGESGGSGASGGGSGGSGGTACYPGDERCPCLAGGACLGSLTCASGICVDLGIGGFVVDTGGAPGASGGVLVEPVVGGAGGSGTGAAGIPGIAGSAADPARVDNCMDGVKNGSETDVDCGPTCLRLDELFLGTPEFVVLKNMGKCATDVAGTGVWIGERGQGHFVATLPAKMVDPGATIRLVDGGVAHPSATDINVGQAINVSARYGGSVLLCEGSCDATSGIIFDAAVVLDGAGIPAGVSFDLALYAVTPGNSQTTAYSRIAYKGQFPKFLSSDWTTTTVAAPNCPSAMPSGGCPGANQTMCTYGTKHCTCDQDFPDYNYVWKCY